MAKLTLTDLASLQNETTAIQVINSNNAAIEAALENTLSRDGTTPNQLEANLDANSQRIINLPSPVSSTDAARLIDVQEAALPDIVIPALAGNGGKIMSNDESTLLWLEPTDIPGLGDVVAANNLSDLDDEATARTNLGLGTAAVEDIGQSGATVPLLSNTNTWSAPQTFSSDMTIAGTATLSGTGDMVLLNAPTTLSSFSVGYRGSPQNTQDAAYGLLLSDAGRTLRHTSASTHTWTIPPNSDVAFPGGTTIIVLNIGSGVVTIGRGSGVSLRIAGSATDSNKSLAQYGLATLYKADTNTWLVSGAGVS